MSDVSLAVALADQWARDYHAWITDPESGLTKGELLGRAANRIEELSRLVTELTAGPSIPLPGSPGSRFSPADFAQSRAAGDE